jgi:hypothetical protein
MTYDPLLVQFSLVAVLLTFVGAWDGLVRRHVRLTARARFGDLHIRGIPAIVIGLLSAGALYIMLKVGVSELGLVSQTCAGDVGCATQTTFASFLLMAGEASLPYSRGDISSYGAEHTGDAGAVSDIPSCSWCHVR